MGSKIPRVREENMARQSKASRRASKESAMDRVKGRLREAAQSMARETGNSYTEFLNSMFSYYQGNLDRARDATKK